MNDQKKECGCACNGLVSQLIQTVSNQSKQMTALINSHASQNEVLCKIVDQNSELMARLETELDDDGEPKSQYLDG